MAEKNKLKVPYSRLANYILEALAMQSLSGSQFQIILAIIRRSYGYGRPSANISLDALASLTRLRKDVICRARLNLVTRKIIIINLNENPPRYRINKRISEWVPFAKLQRGSNTSGYKEEIEKLNQNIADLFNIN